MCQQPYDADTILPFSREDIEAQLPDTISRRAGIWNPDSPTSQPKLVIYHSMWVGLSWGWVLMRIVYLLQRRLQAAMVL